jgi:hypothetical protein
VTPSENIKHEAAEITGRLGYYIPPYRLSSLMKTAQRITDLLTRSDVCMSYAECQIILTIVNGAIDTATGKDENS